jgi:hypothetical protein
MTWTQGEANPRFVVTSLRRDERNAKHLYEKVYCSRGDMENRIKEQLRLWFYSMAYVLLCALRRIGLHDSEFAQATLRHHPSQAAQDRSARSHRRPSHQDRHSVGLSGRRRLGPRRNPPRTRRPGARLDRKTRAAAARPPRGTTH